MPNLRSIAITIALALILAGGLFYITKFVGSANPISQVFTAVQPNPTFQPTASPKPTLPPLDASTNLKSEIDQLSIPDYSNYFQNLKQKSNNL